MGYSNNKPYIPSSTISGCLFSKQKNAKELYSIGKTEGYSPLFVSDGIFINEIFNYKRDGNKLDYISKTNLNTAVFEYETIEKGAQFIFFIEYTIINDMDIIPDKIHDDILNICSKINNGLYRIGFKQNRGLGHLKVLSLKEKIFNFTSANFKLEEYLDFLNKSNVTLDKCNMEDITSCIKDIEDSRDCIVAEIRPVSLINIKTSSRLKEKEDTTALTLINNDEVAVVPGSSLNGALRAYAYRLAKKDNKECLFRKNDDDFNTRYVIDDLYIKGHLITKQRTKINRFTGGADDSALFDEKVFMPSQLIKDEESLKLKIAFYQDIDESAKMYLKKAVAALCKGLVPVGAGTSIGYGIFEGKIIKGGI